MMASYSHLANLDIWECANTTTSHHMHGLGGPQLSLAVCNSTPSSFLPDSTLGSASDYYQRQNLEYIPILLLTVKFIYKFSI